MAGKRKKIKGPTLESVVERGEGTEPHGVTIRKGGEPACRISRIALERGEPKSPPLSSG